MFRAVWRVRRMRWRYFEVDMIKRGVKMAWTRMVQIECYMKNEISQ